MASLGMQMLASSLALLGWVGALLTCILPMWRVTAYIGTTIVTSQTMWEGIWMTCVAQSTGQIMCKPYDSTLALGTDLQAARALTVIALLVASAGLLLAFVGGKCTRFLDGEGKRTKARVLVAAGGTLLVAGLLCIIPVSWTAGAVVKAFYSPHITDSQRRELGGAIYIGWGASILFFLAGGMFCSTACSRDAAEDNTPSVKYVLVRSSVNGGSRPTSGPSVRSQPEGGQWGKPPVMAKPLGSQAPSTWSHNSQAPSTKSQLKRPVSAQSEVSEGPSTKSQLKRADSTKSLELSTKSELNETAAFTDEAPLTPTKTYI
ncbi:claudin-4-like isoform X1 [Clupea harengus]|uniref:Claudin-4-like isoform X1 n=1 Tax=Clupea harengus TaxID=7950 RepID=A0A6P3VI24_CLUHA|nr:claudin-4-like isoform X1 [Clupea harengus]